MNRKTLAPIALLTGALLLASCGTAVADAPTIETTTTTTAQPVVVETPIGTPEPVKEPLASLSTSHLAPASVLADNADYTTVNLHEWDVADAIDVNLANPTSAGVELEGTTVTFTAGGVYRLHGTLNGRVLVDAPDDAQVVLILDSVEIHNAEGAAIEIQRADDVALHLADGSDNIVSDAASYAEEADANAAIYAKQDLTISGAGSLTVNANGNDGITSKDDLVILDGNITVIAADDTLRGKDSLVIEGGTLNLTATGGDGLKSDGDEGDTEIDWSRGYIFVTGGTINITAGDDGMQAFTDTIIAGGSITIDAVDDGVKGEVIVAIGELIGIDEPVVTVTRAEEGIEAASVGISAGTVDVTASDDGINVSGAAELLEISGGAVTVNAEGDGFDSNAALTISGGSTVVYGPTMGGNGSLDADDTMSITGGTLVAFGPGSMEQTPSAGEQSWVLVNAWLSPGQTATISDASGTVIGEFTTAKQAATVIFSSPEIIAGQSYSVASDGAVLGTATAGEGGFGGPGGGFGGGPGGPGRP